MSKRYCTNCGAETSGKICASCGAKAGTAAKCCAWCGEPLNENAAICTKCHEPVKPHKFPLLLRLLFIAVLLSLALSTNTLLGQAAFVLTALLCLSFVDAAIKAMSHNRLNLRPLLFLLRITLIFVIALAAIFYEANYDEAHEGNPSPPGTYKVYKNYATGAAVVVFHEEVKLKNEESFVVNSSEVTYVDHPKYVDEGVYQVKVVLDYSAQNGYGGMNRKDYTIYMIFDSRTGGYYRENDKTKITYTPLNVD